MMSADLDVGERVTVRERTEYFDLAPFEAGSGRSNFDVDADGRLLMISEGRGQVTDRRVVVLNVFEELRRRGGG